MQRKPVFDAVRRMLGRGFRPAEVAALDRALDGAADAETAPEPDEDPVRAAFPTALALVRRFEGCAKRRADGRFDAYPDPGTGGAPWTIGWGATGPDVARGTIWSKAQCDARLAEDLDRCARDVAKALAGAKTAAPQFAALVSFHYNTGAIGRATLTRLHRAGDYEAAAGEFARWVHAGGRVMPGLVRRREAEARLYRSGV